MSDVRDGVERIVRSGQPVAGVVEEMVDALAEVVVFVPPGLARRIRLALDHAHRDAATGAASYQKLADELVACDGYPVWMEPWSE